MKVNKENDAIQARRRSKRYMLAMINDEIEKDLQAFKRESIIVFDRWCEREDIELMQKYYEFLNYEVELYTADYHQEKICMNIKW